MLRISPPRFADALCDNAKHTGRKFESLRLAAWEACAASCVLFSHISMHLFS
jgi:hypothetical protein